MRQDMQFMNAAFHAALRRDLDRIIDTLSASTSLSPTRRQALAEHAVLVLDLLHHHHTSEDTGLWPLVRRRGPDLAELIDLMEAEHATIAPAISAMRSAAQTYHGDGSSAARRALLEATLSLRHVVVPHLNDEETRVMPRVMTVLSDEDWKALARQELRQRGSIPTAGMGLLWTLDGLDSTTRIKFNRQVPAPIRWLIAAIFGRTYRRRAALAFGASKQRRPT